MHFYTTKKHEAADDREATITIRSRTEEHQHHKADCEVDKIKTKLSILIRYTRDKWTDLRNASVAPRPCTPQNIHEARKRSVSVQIL